MADLDPQNQPINRLYSRKQRHDRGIDELIGLAKGVAADGVIVQEEAEFLQSWLLANDETLDTWPANVIFARLEEMLADGVLDQDEQAELLDLVHEFTGLGTVGQELGNAATALPIDKPEPVIIFPGKSFCFTGKFVTGSRDECHAATKAMGGKCIKGITQKLDYLVLGYFGSRDWAHTTHGRKIEKAMEIKDKGFGLTVVSEFHWSSFVHA